MEKTHLTRKLTVREFFKRFPDEETCLEHVMDVRFGLRHTCAKCGTVDATFHRLEHRKAYACASCGDNLYPCAGTIFQDSRTPLQVWFYAIYLFSVSRNGVSGMELHRTLGVTRKTGYRIGVQIRTLMDKANDQANTKLSGHVESDETFVGGAVRGMGRGPYAGGNKTVVLGMKERGGRIVTKVIPNITTETLKAEFVKHVVPGSIVSTDEAKAYGLVGNAGYTHLSVNHSEEDYAHYDYRSKETASVNGVENFWKHFKASIRGTHVHVSREHMPEYLGEFTYRANHREMGNAMFDALIAAL
jgi:transposase